MRKRSFFLRDGSMVYSGKPIENIRQPLTDSPLVAEYIGLMDGRDRIMCGFQIAANLVIIERRKEELGANYSGILCK